MHVVVVYEGERGLIYFCGGAVYFFFNGWMRVKNAKGSKSVNFFLGVVVC
jgi:hypothetical protein